MARGLLSAFPAVLLAAAEAGQVCGPTPDCFDGRCVGTPVEFLPVDLQLDTWTGGGYVRSNASVPAHSLVQQDFGVFLHGPKFRPGQRKTGQYAPPVYVSGSLVDKIWRIDDIQTAPGGALAASKKFVSWASAPSTMWFVPPAYDGGPERFLVAEGNPFFLNPGNHTSEMWLGGVDLVDETKCTTLFPVGGIDKFAGKVVNTVECHASGYCFFSVWKFYDDSLPSDDDCLYWCQTSSPDDPASCTRSGILTDEAGNKLCHVSGTGAVHGFMMGKTDVDNSNSFDMLLLYTGKGTFDNGESHMEMLKVVVSDGEAPKTVSRQAWGTDLTNRTVTVGHDVGCDHAWTDDDGKYIWVGSFREKNDGVHMMDYDTGKLVHSIHGISSVIANKKYTYVSGIDGTGAWGKPGSVLAVATCQEYGRQWIGGESAVLLINISQDVTSTHLNAAAELLVYMTVLRVYAKRQDWAASLAVFREMRERGVKRDSLVLNFVLATGVSADQVEEAAALVEEAQYERPGLLDVVSYNTVIKGYTQRGDAEGALSVLAQMSSRGTTPNSITFNTAMDAAVRGGRVAEAWELLGSMRRAGLPPDKFTCSILVKSFAKGGSKGYIPEVLALLAEVGGSCDPGLLSSLYATVLDAASPDLALLAKTLSQMRAQSVAAPPAARQRLAGAD